MYQCIYQLWCTWVKIRIYLLIAIDNHRHKNALEWNLNFLPINVVYLRSYLIQIYYIFIYIYNLGLPWLSPDTLNPLGQEDEGAWLSVAIVTRNYFPRDVSQFPEFLAGEENPTWIFLQRLNYRFVFSINFVFLFVFSLCSLLILSYTVTVLLDLIGECMLSLQGIGCQFDWDRFHRTWIFKAYTSSILFRSAKQSLR